MKVLHFFGELNLLRWCWLASCCLPINGGLGLPINGGLAS